VSSMAENNIEQVNNRLDRVEEILVAHSERMDVMTQAITQLTYVVEQAHERQERDLAEHDRRIKMMEDVQRDTRAMLQILIQCLLVRRHLGKKGSSLIWREGSRFCVSEIETPARSASVFHLHKILITLTKS
jgi:hypothetical protein